MDPSLKIVLLWLAFALTHMGLSSLRLRRLLVDTLGMPLFRLVYSLISLAIFVPLVWVYFANKHAGLELWLLPRGTALTWTVYVLVGAAFVLVTAGLANPSPAAVVPGDPAPRAVYRITRHPLFMGLALFALAHLLPNGWRADLAFFGGFVAVGLIGAWHQDRRKLAVEPGSFAEFRAGTPFLPFTGRQTLTGLRELSPTVVAVGIGLTILVRYFHRNLFGP